MSTAHKKASLLQKVSKGLTVGSVITGSTFLGTVANSRW
nr:putative acyltransferase [Escherichia coli]